MDSENNYNEINSTSQQPLQKRKSYVWVLIVIVALIFFGSTASFIAPMIVVSVVMDEAVSNEQNVCTIAVTATVTENVKKTTTTQRVPRRQVSGYAPVYSFEYDGRSYVVRSGSTHNPAIYEVGEITEIFIDPSNPTHIYDPKNTNTDGFFSGAFIFGGVTIASVLVIVVTICLIFVRRKKKSEKDEYY